MKYMGYYIVIRNKKGNNMAQQVIAKLNYKNGYKFEITDVTYFNKWLKYTTHKWVCENPFSNETKIFNEV